MHRHVHQATRGYKYGYNLKTIGQSFDSYNGSDPTHGLYSEQKGGIGACRCGSYFLLHVDFFFLKTSSKLGVTGSSRVNNVKHGFTDETDDDEDVDDADEFERVVAICGGAYCGIGAASGGVGGCELGGEGG